MTFAVGQKVWVTVHPDEVSQAREKLGIGDHEAVITGAPQHSVGCNRCKSAGGVGLWYPVNVWPLPVCQCVIRPRDDPKREDTTTWDEIEKLTNWNPARVEV